METRAHHLLIGSFMLILIFGLLAFILWLAKVDGDRDYERYLVFFEGSVTGLNEGSAVRLNGVPVGTVLDISIPREDPSKVRVLVRIDADVPIREGSTARLELQGFTGIAFVQISGGQAGGDIVAGPGEELAVIPSERSPIQQVFEEAPNLINEAILAISHLREILGPDNRDRIAAILANLETVSGSFAERAEDIENVLGRMDSAIADFQQTARAFAALAESGQSLIDGEARALMAQATDTAAAAERTIGEIEGLASDNREAISRFANSALPEAARLVADLRRLSLRLNRVAETFEERPQEALFGPHQPEYRAGEPK